MSETANPTGGPVEGGGAHNEQVRVQHVSARVPERVDSIMRGTPMKRFGEADELVGALLLLVSPIGGQFITGTHINVDGGFTAAWF